MKRRAIIVVVVVAIVLALLHALGVRRSTSVLAGIATDPVDATLALVYIGCWFFTVLIAPIVLLTCALLGLDRYRRSIVTPTISSTSG